MSRFRLLAVLASLVLAPVLSGTAVADDLRGGEKTSPTERLQELKARLDRFEANLPPDQRVGPGRLADAKLAWRKARTLLALQAQWSFGGQPAWDELARAERDVAALGRTEPLGAPRTGFQERAYLSEIDGSPEPYLLYVPARYDAARDWPLLIFLHGYHPDLDAANWIDMMYPSALQELCEREGIILLVPYGRGNTEFMGIGEQDVLRTMDYVRREYRVDPRRVVISGVSMGGSGAYSIACHYPHLFAGVVAFTGRVDYYSWMGVPKESLPRFKQVQVDTDYARELLPNLLHVPVLIFHGSADFTLALEQSRLMRDLLTKLGLRPEYVEVKGADHFEVWRPTFMQHPSLIELLRNARVPERPTEVRFRTFTLKYPSAFWVTIRDIQDWGKPVEIRAKVDPDGTISVQAENVRSFGLGPGLPESVKLPPKVTVNGKAPDSSLMARDGSLIMIGVDISTRQELRKTPKLCGPIREAYAGPFTIVYPGGAGPACDADRENAKRLLQEWFEYAQGVAAFKSDAEISKADIGDRNLILCGSPATNRVLAQIADKLPIQIKADKYVAGEKEFPRAANGMQMIYPNPQNPSRYVLVVEGAPWGPQLQRNHKLDLLPDFIIYASDTVDDKTLFPTNRFLCAGYFDSRWRLSDASTWVNANPKAGASDFER